jgi:hypothetical protein
MGYRTDQFYGIEFRGEAGYFERYSQDRPPGSEYSSGANNPDFAYPSRVVRTNDHDGYKSTQLRRGYMRSLRTQADGIEVAVNKCQFQFNPAVLEQSVVQPEGLLNVFQSDPAQYAQPIPGNVSFGFSLLFDRTMEVNNPSKGSSGNFNPDNPWELSDPSEVGVLRDLASMYAVIGQGISSSQDEYLKALLSRQLTLENDREETPDDTAVTTATSAIPEFLNMNTGNVAFLLPVPVRIVFSSLYIVEGFVASTSVKFTKFSTQMVPIQCSVAVNVDAKYIGFAKKDTFLSLSLEKEIKDREEALASEIEASRGVSEAGSSAMGSVDVAAVLVTDEGKQVTMLTLYDFLFNLAVPARPRAKVSARPGVSQEPITKKFRDMSITKGMVTGAVEVYGPFTSSITSATTQTALAQYLNAQGGITKLVRARSFAGATSGSDTANMVSSTAEEWEKSAAGALGPPLYDAPIADDSATAYYLVKYRANVELTGLDASSATGKGEYYVVVPPNSDTYVLSRAISLAWPTYGQTSPGSAITVTSPLSRTAPGSSSTVGAPPGAS